MRFELSDVVRGREVDRDGRVVDVPEPVRAWRARATCAACEQRIGEAVPMQVRNGHVYHPSCAARAPVPAAPAAPRTLAILSGSAGTLFDPAGCMIADPDGSVRQHERFTSGAFDAVRPDAVDLCINHRGPALRGAFLSITEDARELKFEFRLLDGPRERDVVDKIHRGLIRGCSVRFTAAASDQRYVGHMLEYTHVHLKEISLADGARPVWYGSRVEVDA